MYLRACVFKEQIPCRSKHLITFAEYLSISYRTEKCEDFNMEALCVYVCICVCVLLRPNSLSEPEYFCILEKNH